MSTPATSPFGRASRSAAVAVLALTGALFGIGLGEREVVSEELRFAEVAREMRLTGDYFHPTINGRSYYDKPLGSYWLIAAASRLTGGVDETAARLPAAVAGWLGVLLVMLLAARLYDGRTALLAGALLATCYGFAFYARRATADAETAVGTLAAVTLFAHCRHRQSGAWVVALWAIMGLTSLTKGLLGFALPATVLGTFGIWEALAERTAWRSLLRDLIVRNGWFFTRWTIIAAPLGVAIFLIPYALSGWQSGWGDGLALVYRENVKRFFQPHNHTGPIYLYVPVVFVLAAPWGLFLPAALVPRRGDRTADRLALAYFWGIFLFFTLSASRRSYYLLPVLPAAALLVARLWATPPESLRPLARWLRGAGYAIGAAGVLGAGILLVPPADLLPPPYDALPALPARPGFAIGWLGASALCGWGYFRPARRPIAALGIAGAGLAFAFWIALPALEGHRTRREFAADVNRAVAAEPDRVGLYRARDLAFQLGRRKGLPDFEEAGEFREAARTERIRWVIVRKRYLPQLGDVRTSLVLEEGTRPWEGADQLGDKMLLLEIAP